MLLTLHFPARGGVVLGQCQCHHVLQAILILLHDCCHRHVISASMVLV